MKKVQLLSVLALTFFSHLAFASDISGTWRVLTIKQDPPKRFWKFVKLQMVFIPPKLPRLRLVLATHRAKPVFPALHLIPINRFLVWMYSPA